MRGMFNTRLRKIMIAIPLLGIAAALMMGADACSTASTTSAQVAYIVGNGQDGNDAKIHKIAYPGEKVDIGDGEEALYVPAGSRNFIINPKGQVNAGGQAIGDRHNPVLARTKPGTKIKMWLEIDWTLNQSKPALTKFYDVCFKYDCFTDSEQSNDVNFASPGWNGWLGEQVSPSIDSTMFAVMTEYGDEVWKSPTDEIYKKIAAKASELFWSELRARTGYTENLICGSGNSVWLDTKHQEFECTQVRFIITGIEPQTAELDKTNDQATQAEQEKALNEKRFSSAEKLYGNQTNYWLGVQDSVGACKEAGVTCVVTIGGASPVVSVPTGK